MIVWFCQTVQISFFQKVPFTSAISLTEWLAGDTTCFFNELNELSAIA